MRCSEAWLREWVNPPLDTQNLANQLSMAGLNVDAIEPVAPFFQGVFIGLVESIIDHPKADKLKICQVNLGHGELLQIVCGAANVKAGMKVPLASDGAQLPGDVHIKHVKLRGVQSQGMICSAKELGLAEISTGILELSSDAPLGMDFRQWLNLDDHCFEFDLTPDRADCFSIKGLAREIAALNQIEFNPAQISAINTTTLDQIEVRLLTPAACPRYACRILQDIDSTALTPFWLREHLRRSGIRSIHPVVDVTNYVMLELGQPMHGFDLAQLNNEIQIRFAYSGEILLLLNGETAQLRADSLVIADNKQAVALAGVMGGANTAVNLNTRGILLESAFFAPAAIRGQARSYGLQTESAQRFERGVDPTLQIAALERATQLLQAIVGGKIGPIIEKNSPEHLPKNLSIQLRSTRITQILGLELNSNQIQEILERLGMDLKINQNGWLVTPPSARFDLIHEVDLIAEIGRIYGYDHIPTRQSSTSALIQPLPEARFELERAKLRLVERGFQEVITYSFVNPELQILIDPQLEPWRLANPLSSELAVMRTSLWPGLLQTASHNLARQQTRIRIFESGLRFRPELNGLQQTMGIGGLILGSAQPEQWGQPTRMVDFFDLKADIESLLALTGDLKIFKFIAATHPALHPGQTAQIKRDGINIGWLGMLHPSLITKLDLPTEVFLFELELDLLNPGRVPVYQPIPKVPALRRDLALIIDEKISYAKISQCITDAIPDFLRELVLFDIYTGHKIDSRRKSLALGLILQSFSQTLTTDLIEIIVNRVLNHLATELGASLRS